MFHSTCASYFCTATEEIHRDGFIYLFILPCDVVRDTLNMFVCLCVCVCCVLLSKAWLKLASYHFGGKWFLEPSSSPFLFSRVFGSSTFCLFVTFWMYTSFKWKEGIAIATNERERERERDHRSKFCVFLGDGVWTSPHCSSPRQTLQKSRDPGSSKVGPFHLLPKTCAFLFLFSVFPPQPQRFISCDLIYTLSIWSRSSQKELPHTHTHTITL